jgi:hypothetical protein
MIKKIYSVHQNQSNEKGKKIRAAPAFYQHFT